MAKRPYFSSRHFGDTSVTLINEGTGWYRATVIDGANQPVDPFGPENPEGLPIGFHVIHIRTPQASVLVDSGFDDPGSEWDKEFSRSWFVERTGGVAAALAAIGESEDSITHVAITHAHFDHVAGLTKIRNGSDQPRFPNARVFLGRGDHKRTGDDPALPDISRRLKVIADHGLLVAVDEDTEIAPGVAMTHTGGESPGHCVVTLGSGEFIALGDLIHYPFEVEHFDWMVPWADRPAMLDAREKFLAAAARERTSVVFSHHPFPPWGRVEKSEGGYRWLPDK